MAVLPSTMPMRSAASGKEMGHRTRVVIACAVSLLLVASVGIYGASYYLLPLDQRPFSDKYEMLKPSGSSGLKLGILGTVLFVIIFLYALRKVVPWLGRLGSATHWMDFHIVAGVTAPIVIAYHASFKFYGIAGVAFWLMIAVALSGIIGRYLYAQIPRSRTAAELTLGDLQITVSELEENLRVQSLYSAEQLRKALFVPSAEQVRQIGPLRAIGKMLVLDMSHSFQVAALRRASTGMGGKFLSFGGWFSSGNREVEHVIRLVKQKAAISKRVVYLDQAHRVFHLWHVIHRPFSYAFATLALFHIAVALGLGFATMGFR